ncbi:MAG: hypothetical protein GMKNLPBB_02366 [Myxococcota bacterium]|nr:hypothetical protein [Myxococcota bacterium]
MNKTPVEHPWSEEETISWLTDYALGTLVPGDRERVENWLAQDESRRELLDDIRRSLAQITETPPWTLAERNDFSQRVMRDVRMTRLETRELRNVPPPVPLFRRPWFVSLTSAACAAVVVMMVMKPGPRPANAPVAAPAAELETAEEDASENWSAWFDMLSYDPADDPFGMEWSLGVHTDNSSPDNGESGETGDLDQEWFLDL